MNDKQKLEYYRFLRDDSRTRLQINDAILAFLEELRFGTILLVLSSIMTLKKLILSFFM